MATSKLEKDTTFYDHMHESKVFTLNSNDSVDIEVNGAGGVLLTSLSNSNHVIAWVHTDASYTVAMGSLSTQLTFTSLGSGKVRIKNNLTWWIPMVWLG